MKHHREIQDQVEREFGERPILKHGKKHTKAYFKGRFVVLSNSPSSQSSQQNALSEFRRIAR